MRGGRGRRLLRGSIACAVLLPLVIVYCGRQRQRAIALPNGSTLVLKSVTYGTNHLAPPQMLSLLRERLPPAWRSVLGVQRPGRFSPVQPHIVFWLVVRHPDRGAQPVLGGMAAKASLFDTNGIEQRDLEWQGHWANDSGESFEAFSSAVFPRRQPLIRLRLHWPSSPNDPGPSETPLRPLDFIVRNPLSSRWPEWTPTSLPASVTNDATEFTLVGLEVEVAPSAASAAASPARSVQATARFAITEAGKPFPDWTVDRLQVSDATGNSVRLAAQRIERVVPATEVIGSESVTFPWPLWLDEPAYQLQFEFVRKPDAAFTPDEVCEVRGVAVPRADAISTINLRTNLLGYDLSLLALVGEHATLPGREHDVFGQTTLEVEFPTLPDSLRFDVVSVVDDAGRQAEPAPGAGSQSYGFKIPEDAKTVNLKVALSKRRIAGYLVKPVVRKAGW